MPALLCFVMPVMALQLFVFVFEKLTDKEGYINKWLLNKGYFVKIVVKVFQLMLYTVWYSVFYYILIAIMAHFIYHIAV